MSKAQKNRVTKAARRAAEKMAALGYKTRVAIRENGQFTLTVISGPVAVANTAPVEISQVSVSTLGQVADDLLEAFYAASVLFRVRFGTESAPYQTQN